MTADPSGSIRRSLLVASFALVGLTIGCGGESTSLVRCAQPTLALSIADPAAPPTGPPPSAAPGRVVTATAGGALRASGDGFGSACSPSGGDVLVGEPLNGIRLYVTQGEQRVSVAQMNASVDGHAVDIVFGVPGSLRAGRAAVVAQMGEGASVVPIAVVPFEVTAA